MCLYICMRMYTNLGGFIDDFLDVVFGETTMASVVHFADKGNGFGLGYGHHPDLVGLGSNPLRCLLDPVQNRLERRRGRTLHGWSGHHFSPSSLHGRFGNSVGVLSWFLSIFYYLFFYGQENLWLLFYHFVVYLLLLFFGIFFKHQCMHACVCDVFISVAFVLIWNKI